MQPPVSRVPPIYYPERFDPTRPTVLCVESFQFQTDIAMLRSLGQRFQYITIGDHALAKAQAPWMPLAMMEQHYCYFQKGPEADLAWDKCEELGHEIIAEVKKRANNLVAVMAGHWSYWQDEGLRRACKELHIPFLTLLKENFLSENNRQLAGNFLQNFPIKLDLDGVAVAGESTANVVIGCECAPSSKVRLTGLPRFDQWLLPIEPMFDRPIVLLSYVKGYFADGHFEETLQIFSDIAARFPEIPFVVKAKHAGEFPMIDEALRKVESKAKAVLTSHMPALVANARAILGFNSLALFEGLLTEAQILIPQWGKAQVDPRKQAPAPNDPRIADHMRFFDGKDAFVRAVEIAATTEPPEVDPAERLRVFQYYIRLSIEQSATERVEDFIAEFTS